MEFQQAGGALEVALLLAAALNLHFAEVIHRLLELAGEALVMHAESSDGAVGVNDVEVNCRLIGGRVGGAIEEGGFEGGNAFEAPCGVSEFLREVGLGGSGGFVFAEKATTMRVVRGAILGGEDGGVTGEAVGEGVLGRALFAGGGAGAGGAVGCWWLVVGCWWLGMRDPGLGSGLSYGNLRCGFSMD
jgi:hypothetical protein